MFNRCFALFSFFNKIFFHEIAMVSLNHTIIQSLTAIFLFCGVTFADTLKTEGAYACTGFGDSLVQVSNFTFIFDRATNNVTYYVEGISKEEVSIIGK